MNQPSKLLYLTQADVEAINMPMRQMIDVLEDAFRLKGQGHVEMPPKPGVHPRPNAFIHAMPAFLRGDEEAVGMKWISGFPENGKRGLPYISGLLILNDPETGIPLCVMDAVWITAMRTGAATALAAKYLARDDSTTVGILGCGVQGCTNLEALCDVREIQHVYAYDLSEQASSDFADHMSKKTGVRIEVVTDPQQAVSKRDIVVTAGPILKKPHQTIKKGWFDPGTFVSPVDFDCYMSPEAMAEASMFCTDDTKQLLYYQRQGYFQDIPPLYGDLGEIVSGQKQMRSNKDEIIICANLGLAMDDIAVGHWIYQRSKDLGIGNWLPL